MQGAAEPEIDLLLSILDSNVRTNLLSLHISVKNYDEMKQYMRSKFKVVKAAGGLVRKKDKFLMIYRMKKWDLPKGKKKSWRGASKPRCGKWRRSVMLVSGWAEDLYDMAYVHHE